MVCGRKARFPPVCSLGLSLRGFCALLSFSAVSLRICPVGLEIGVCGGVYVSSLEVGLMRGGGWYVGG